MAISSATSLSDRVRDLVYQRGRGSMGVTLETLTNLLNDPEGEVRREVICALTTSKASRPTFKARYNVINDQIRLWQDDFEPRTEFNNGDRLPCRLYSPFVVTVEGEVHLKQTVEQAVLQAGPAGITFPVLRSLFDRLVALEKKQQNPGNTLAGMVGPSSWSNKASDDRIIHSKYLESVPDTETFLSLSVIARVLWYYTVSQGIDSDEAIEFMRQNQLHLSEPFDPKEIKEALAELGQTQPVSSKSSDYSLLVEWSYLRLDQVAEVLVRYKGTQDDKWDWTLSAKDGPIKFSDLKLPFKAEFDKSEIAQIGVRFVGSDEIKLISSESIRITILPSS